MRQVQSQHMGTEVASLAGGVARVQSLVTSVLHFYLSLGAQVSQRTALRSSRCSPALTRYPIPYS